MDLSTILLYKDFSKMKDREVKQILEFSNVNDYYNFTTSIFTHSIENIYGDYKIPVGKIEYYLNSNGVAAFTKDDDNIITVGIANIVGIGKYGIGSTVLITLENGIILERTNGVDCVLMFNNNNHTMNIDIINYVRLMTEIDVSLNNIIKKTRMNPIPIAKTRNDKKALDNALTNTDNGNTHTILSDNILNDLSDGNTNIIDILNLTDVNASNNIQYLTMLRNELKNNFYSKYGLSAMNNRKLAQQSVEEVNDRQNISMSLIYQMLEQREKAYEKINELYGTDFTVELSKSWKNEDNELTENNIENNEMEEGVADVE